MTLKVDTESPFFALEELAKLDRKQIPKHIAIIPDGNRRWAKQHQTTSLEGHHRGVDNLINIVLAGRELGVEIFTFYLFSTENWNRSQEEIDALMILLKCYLIEQCPTMIQKGIKLETIGNLSRLAPHVIETIHQTKAATAKGSKVQMIFGLNYGGRDDICRAVDAILKDHREGKLSSGQPITEELISRYLDTSPWQDPDLLIRTSGEMRLSNFLLWQISYSELYVSPSFWPDFTCRHLLDAILCFQQRDRRLGGS